MRAGKLVLMLEGWEVFVRPVEDWCRAANGMRRDK